jgi:hypothetical protein
MVENDRDLTADELRDVATWLGEKPWNELSLDVGAERAYDELYRGDHLSTWLIHWGDEADTGFHDHDESAGAVHVVRGRVREERLRLGGEPEVREYGPGETFTIGEEPALTIHAYSPPLTRMGSYVVEDSGVLTRYAMSYEHELRPLKAA